MGMRPSDNDIDRENREAETYAEAAQRALAMEAVTKWNKLMERSAARHKPWLVADDWRCRRGPVLFSRCLLPRLPADQAGRPAHP